MTLQIGGLLIQPMFEVDGLALTSADCTAFMD